MQVSLVSCSARHPTSAAHLRPALKDVTLQVAAGEQVAVIGPSGAGKTSLLQVMACAMRPSAGDVLLASQDPWAVSPRELQALRRSLFLAPQVPPLPPRQRVVTAVLAGQLPHMGLWRSLRNLFYPLDIPAADAALEGFGLSDKLFERVDRLSGGERQRVGLARALVSQTSLWLVDEPLSALDPNHAEQAMRSLTQTARARSVTLVASLHHVEMALAHFPRVVGLRQGEVVFDLPTGQVSGELLNALYAQHLHELHGPASELSAVPTAAAPVAVQCR